MTQFSATIKNVRYKKILPVSLPVISALEEVNRWKSKCRIQDTSFSLAVSKWVSPKRTRSYPYSRVYDTLDSNASKVVTIIPIVKDEGKDGDLDYLQWDTVSLMNLLNVYVILAFYTDADKNRRAGRKPHKITAQKFDPLYIMRKIEEVNHYHASALHWNIDQLQAENLNFLMEKVSGSYNRISRKLNVQMHSPSCYERFRENITVSVESFMHFSRKKSKLAQSREAITVQPKEALGTGTKTTIEIVNYQGGNYFLTVDEVVTVNEKVYLVECKHSSTGLIPSKDDIKDGLIKMFIFSNIAQLSSPNKSATSIPFKPVMRLTSEKISGDICSTNSRSSISQFFIDNGFNVRQKEFLNLLLQEANANNFEIWIGKGERKK